MFSPTYWTATPTHPSAVNSVVGRVDVSPDPTTPAPFSQAMDSMVPENLPNTVELDAQMEELSPAASSVTPTYC
jgi:hypothetical protein